jgi:protoheme IX farnesyltransferase
LTAASTFASGFTSRQKKFITVLFWYTILIIAWGAFVRASFSGDGCGANWPDCHGALFPKGGSFETWVEFIHRASTGIYLPMVLVVMRWTYKLFPAKSAPRKAALGITFFTLLEAALGAKLVLKGLVTTNDSVLRAVVMGIHLVNTYLLLASILLLMWHASGRTIPKFRGQGAMGGLLLIGAISMLVLGATGGIAALGNMLQPSAGLVDGLRQDLDPSSHFSVRLRLSHPFVATSVGVLLIYLVGFGVRQRFSDDTKTYGRWLLGLFVGQMLFGIANLLAKAPIAMQLTHLVWADMIWAAFILFGLSALTVPAPHEEHAESSSVSAPEPTGPQPALWKSYIALTKPRVISLLLFTTITAAFVAARGWPGGWLLLALTFGGYFAAGAANAINMVYDRDIDLKMARTASRPTVTQQISNTNALLFAFTLATLSFVWLTLAANLLTAFLALAGLLFYVFVYTMGLKRRTWQNIVIGGAAGAFPPLVGYAGVTNNLSPLAWTLFAIIFLWTPVHFWALALLIKDDYRDAGIPMLPVVHGDRATVIQIAVYTVLTAVVSVLPLFMNSAGFVYLVASILLNAVLFVRSFQLYRRPEKAPARVLFKYSMVYLAVLFLTLAIDRATVL